jgi:hypothetical protein
MASIQRLKAMAMTIGVLVTGAAASSATLADVVLGDEVRIAFYESAPPSMETSMRSAVTHACDSTESGSWTWLCGGAPLRFLREVNVLGDRYETGLVCSEEVVTPDLRYYTPDMFEDEPECQYVGYDFRTSVHLLGLDPAAPPDASTEQASE